MERNQLLQRVNEKLKNFGRPVFLARTGSKLYGTNTPNSDDDFVGVFVPNKKYLLGFQNVDEVDCSVKSKDESGKNTKDAVDVKMYALPKFLKLAADVNPNVVELLFVNEENVLLLEDDFKVFMDNYELFVNQRVKHSFQGYAHQQFKKGVTKAQNFSELRKFLELLEKYDDNDLLAVVMEKEQELQKYNKGNFLQVAGLSFQKNLFNKKVKKLVKDKLTVASHRAEMWEKYGYDTKFFMHLFRLLNEGEDLLTKGKLEFPVREKEFLLDVRNGKFSLEFLQEEAERRFEKFKNVETNLPKKANWNKLEELMVQVLQKEVCKN